jgi:hypothetical protein
MSKRAEELARSLCDSQGMLMLWEGLIDAELRKEREACADRAVVHMRKSGAFRGDELRAAILKAPDA